MVLLSGSALDRPALDSPTTTAPAPKRLRAALTARGPHGSTTGWRGVSWQLLVLLPPSVLYFIVRELSSDQRGEAFDNAAAILSFQKTLGLDWEQSLQQRVLDYDALIAVANWVYIYGHFPLLLGSMLLLFRLHRGEFLTLRNSLIASGAIGLVCFALYPVAPPRLFDPNAFFDTVGELSSSYRILQNPSITNQFAAVPSFHVGWNLLVAIALWRATPLRPIKALAALLPVLMICSVVLTANHWIIDILAGMAVAFIGCSAAAAFNRYLVPKLAPSQRVNEPISASR